MSAIWPLPSPFVVVVASTVGGTEMFWIASYLLLFGLILGLAFLLLGALRTVAQLSWRVDQLEATCLRPGRSGLPLRSEAPPFTLPTIDGGEMHSSDWLGQRWLLVFVQAGCSPCARIVPALNRLHRTAKIAVVAITRGSTEPCQAWCKNVDARFPVLIQEDGALSRRYQIFATPFAFLIDEQGRIASKGIINQERYLHFVLDRTGEAEQVYRRNQRVLQSPLIG